MTSGGGVGRLATALLAVVLVVLLAGASVLAFIGDQVFLAAVGGIGAFLTGWALISARKAA